jgi:hypothetical protein
LDIFPAKKAQDVRWEVVHCTGTEEKKENSPRRVQTFSPPCRFSLNAIVIEINPLDINRVTFLHVARNSSVTVARGQH